MMIVRSVKFWIAPAILAAMVGGSRPGMAQEAGQEQQKSLYDRLGGLAPITVVVSDFIDVMVPDPLLNENPAIDASRHRVPPEYLKYHVTAMVCQATGGPCQYHGRSMKASHVHLNISEREWNRMVTLLEEVLAEHEVPARETRELLEIVDSTKSAIVVSRG
jgi:hemoglobin